MSTSSGRFAVPALALFALLTTVDAAGAWTCTATSRVASGWGMSPYRGTAQQIALSQCAVRTPRGLMCRIRTCRR